MKSDCRNVLLGCVLSALLVSGYAMGNEGRGRHNFVSTLNRVGVPDKDGSVVKGRIMLAVAPNGRIGVLDRMGVLAATPVNVNAPVTVTLAASTTLELDDALWVAPTPSNAMLDFGQIGIKNLIDNDLNACGTGTERCTRAWIRMYTMGAMDGIYNSTLNLSAPITAGYLGETPLHSIGRNVAGSAVLEEFSIPSGAGAVVTADFTHAVFNVKADFTPLSAGTYGTTLYIEYGTSLL